jgi:hypothetical protein
MPVLHKLQPDRLAQWHYVSVESRLEHWHCHRLQSPQVTKLTSCYSKLLQSTCYFYNYLELLQVTKPNSVYLSAGTVTHFNKMKPNLPVPNLQ